VYLANQAPATPSAGNQTMDVSSMSDSGFRY